MNYKKEIEDQTALISHDRLLFKLNANCLNETAFLMDVDLTSQIALTIITELRQSFNGY